ncbi:MAG: hypothetical protein JWR69_4167, partial [Pedosphaera sp.]|nr:hypothetical protein [Pedosphaera sp.]
MLATRCCQEIVQAVKELKFIRDNPVQKKPKLASTRLRQFRRVSAWIDRIENEAIAAIARAHEGESKIHGFLFKMTGEIFYPIEPPTISLLSQQYFFAQGQVEHRLLHGLVLRVPGSFGLEPIRRAEARALAGFRILEVKATTLSLVEPITVLHNRMLRLSDSEKSALRCTHRLGTG